MIINDFSKHCDVCEYASINAKYGLYCTLMNVKRKLVYKCGDIYFGEKFVDEIIDLEENYKSINEKQEIIKIFRKSLMYFGIGLIRMLFGSFKFFYEFNTQIKFLSFGLILILGVFFVTAVFFIGLFFSIYAFTSYIKAKRLLENKLNYINEFEYFLKLYYIKYKF